MLDHRLNTRTVYLNPINRYLYWNMGYHVEHHMFPMVPYHALGKLHELMKADCPPPYNGLIEAYREVIPALIRQSKDPDYYVQRPLPAPSRRRAARSRPERYLHCRPDAAGWIEACDLGRSCRGMCCASSTAGQTYAIYRTQIGQLFATDGFCTHGQAHLADGFLQGTCIECPKHNGRFDIRDGSVRRPPPRRPLQDVSSAGEGRQGAAERRRDGSRSTGDGRGQLKQNRLNCFPVQKAG